MLVLMSVLAACGGPAATSAPTTASASTVASAAPQGGSIVFGMAFSEQDFKITAPAETFSRAFPGIVYYIVSFSEAPGVASITTTLTRETPAGKELVWSRPTQIADPGAPALAAEATLPQLDALQPGVYVMRFVRDGTVLAEGHFEVN